MPDLICLIPSHGYADDTPVTVSWLGSGIYYITDSDIATTNKSFKLAESIGGSVVQYTVDVTEGFVREDTGTGVTTIRGLDHLEGQFVTVTSGGEVIGGFTVSGGTITLTSELTTYQAGLPYTCKIRTTRLASPQAGDALQGRVKKINRSVVRYSKSKEGKGGQEYPVQSNAGEQVMTEFMSDLNMQFDTDSRDSVVPVSGGMATEGYSTIISELPHPMTIISNVIDFSVEEQR
jgi:hypothetical protein